MPLNVPVGDAVGALELRCDGDPESMFVTLGLRAQTPPFDNGHAFHLYEAFLAGFRPVMGDTYQLFSANIYVRQEDGSNEILTHTSVSVRMGLGSSNSLPQNTAVLIRKNTARGGRQGKGRLYFPGVPEGNVDNIGNIASATRALWQGAADSFLFNLQNTGEPGEGMDDPMIPLLLHNDLDDPDVITSLTVMPVVATQRRRLRR